MQGMWSQLAKKKAGARRIYRVSSLRVYVGHLLTV
jgi:hypothetical protein